MKIGLFFGSFNPIHMGHLIIAQSFINQIDLDELWFVVSPHNPLKDQQELNDADLRLDLVRDSIKSNEKFKLCDIEFSLSIPSYTIDTLSELKKKYPEHSFELLIGSDSLDSFSQWKNFKQILNNFTTYVYPRKKDYKIPEEFTSYSIEIVNLPILYISSTHIRKLLANGKSIKYLVPEVVYNYFN
ncbi:MAG: nicotinate-nucleotide adenylyltransferase [Bacteroidetes bacterium]|jgi:nicotinate-nucleotide adenylyltransferase|nr:nicotinate-nucleotide adenylyltransferase [Bacteroidota bacterium]MBT6836708.1 nicotinate-nucleotide adenylyltransferase [Bacteroidota bacterium]